MKWGAINNLLLLLCASIGHHYWTPTAIQLDLNPMWQCTSRQEGGVFAVPTLYNLPSCSSSASQKMYCLNFIFMEWHDFHILLSASASIFGRKGQGPVAPHRKQFAWSQYMTDEPSVPNIAC